MPQWTCPCGKKWNRTDLSCMTCGFSYSDLLGNPTTHLKKFKQKHIKGCLGYVQDVSVIDDPERYDEIFLATASCGSKTSDGIYLTWEDKIAHFDDTLEPLRHSHLVKPDSKNKPHIIFRSDEEMEGKIFTCKKCGHQHKSECPKVCSSCGEFMWE